MADKTIQLSSLADSGMWISDDRANALISCACHGIAEICYHGKQPVSRNSRILQSENGVFTFFYRSESNEFQQLQFDLIGWYPAGVRITQRVGADVLVIEVTAHERKIIFDVRSTGARAIEVQIRYNPDSQFKNVHGKRVWQLPWIGSDMLHLSCRDVILLNDWIRRTGPYAGDFLIPEPWRRIIYRRRCRSGLATLDDMREEYRDAEIPIYDAEVFMRIGGERWILKNDVGAYSFTTQLGNNAHSANLIVEFNDTSFQGNVISNEVRNPINDADTLRSRHTYEQRYFAQDDSHVSAHQKTRYDIIDSTSPHISLHTYPHIESFFAGVPSLVESCVVKDFEMTRANPGAYYWIWAWDNIVTGIEMSRWGDIDRMKSMVQFINAHRDANGIIPGRWTRDLLPLDTPIRGSLEFLFTLLTFNATIQSGERRHLIEVYPYMVEHFHALHSMSDEKGFFKNIGCYPDLPKNFNRTEQSIVAMEIAAAYGFYRILEIAALMMNDNHIAALSRESALRVQEYFIEAFWDDARGFFFDSFDVESFERNESYPLFTFLFLATAPGLSLIDKKIDQLAAFISMNHLTEFGVSLTPSWDKNWQSESVTHAWYPHWDIYMIKLLRRAGHVNDIMKWLAIVEKTLLHLGYCPEFLSLDGFLHGDPNPYRLHGAVSNLNCATGWYRALIEGVIGIEFDPGGMTIIPLALPIEKIELHHLFDRQTTWDFLITNDGDYLEEIFINDTPLHGCLKIPLTFYDRSHHKVTIRYSTERKMDFYFTEIVNAEVLSVVTSDSEITLRIHTLGMVDVSFTSPMRPQLFLDGGEFEFKWDETKKCGRTQLTVVGEHSFALRI